MVDNPQTGLEGAFHKRLLAAVAEVKQLTHAGVQQTLERIQNVGGLQAAKEELHLTFNVAINRPWDPLSDYFWAATSGASCRPSSAPSLNQAICGSSGGTAKFMGQFRISFGR